MIFTYQTLSNSALTAALLFNAFEFTNAVSHAVRTKKIVDASWDVVVTGIRSVLTAAALKGIFHSSAINFATWYFFGYDTLVVVLLVMLLPTFKPEGCFLTTITPDRTRLAIGFYLPSFGVDLAPPPLSSFINCFGMMMFMFGRLQ